MAHPQQAGRRFPFLLGEAWGRRKPPARFRQRTRQPRGALASRMDLPNRMPSVSAKISQGFNQQMSADQALPGEITDLLHRWGEGDSAALSSIASVTYDDLRSIAHGYLQRENRAHTLQATGLVNELYLRLTQQRGARLTDRRHFAWVDASGSDMLALDQALAELEALDERKVRAVELRYFLGCTNGEAADLLKVSRATFDRDLQFSKSWLYRRLHATASESAENKVRQDPGPARDV
jgi:predicted DNA-binding protein (UPF0251 family)